MAKDYTTGSAACQLFRGGHEKNPCRRNPAGVFEVVSFMFW
jgi:hypothetical protein